MDFFGGNFLGLANRGSRLEARARRLAGSQARRLAGSQNSLPPFKRATYNTRLAASFVCVAEIDHTGVEQKKKSLAPRYVIYFNLKSNSVSIFHI